jgi:hypothetical protein
MNGKAPMISMAPPFVVRLSVLRPSDWKGARQPRSTCSVTRPETLRISAARAPSFQWCPILDSNLAASAYT